MNEAKKLCPTTLGEDACAKCRAALNVWSQGLAFSLTQTLGDDISITRADMYHAYEFNLESRWTHREFTLEDSGTPVPSPRDIDSYDLWDDGIHGVDDDCRLELSDTCYKTICESCGGHGQYECTKCHGEKEIACPTCGGSGESACQECHGKGVVDCEACGGKGRVYCPHCSGGGKIGAFQTTTLKSADCGYCGHTGVVQCSACGGSRHEQCHKCHGSGKDTCTECHGDRKVVCTTCEGSGIETCPSCDGRGWNPHVWTLMQEQKTDEASRLWFDDGFVDGKQKDDYCDYGATLLVDEIAEDGSRVQQSVAQALDAPFVEELKTLWKESDGRLVMATGARDADRFRYQHATVAQYDVAVRIEYTYKGSAYVIWVDLTNGEVYEGPRDGLMAEWARKLTADADAASASGDAPLAMKNYAMACVVSEDNADPSLKLNKLMNRQAWFFRIGAAVTAAIWWGGYCCHIHGWKGLLVGLASAAYIVGLDMLSLSRKTWMAVTGQVAMVAAGTAGYMLVFGENGFLDASHKSFLMGCGISLGALMMLIEHDFGCRMHFLKVPHKWLMLGLGALAGWACSPAIVVGCSAVYAKIGNAAFAVSIGLLALAGVRTMTRIRLLNFGQWASKMKTPEDQRKFVGQFEKQLPDWLVPALLGAASLWLVVSLVMYMVVK